MKILRVKREDQNALERFLESGQKVKAIKHLRDLTGSGIREAKDVIDQMAGKVIKNPVSILRNPWCVESIKVTSPTGKSLELSMSNLELKFLQEIDTISMDEVADLLDLTEFLKKWQKSRA